jgi:hypothetical protein
MFNSAWLYLKLLVPNVNIGKINKRFFLSKYMRLKFGDNEVISIRFLPIQLNMTYVDKYDKKIHKLDLLGLTFPRTTKVRAWLESKGILLVKIRVITILIDGLVFYESRIIKDK